MAEPTWERDGLIVLRGVLTPDLLEQLGDAVDELYSSYCSGEIANWSLDSETATSIPGLWSQLLELPRDHVSFRRWHIAADRPCFRHMIDYEPVFCEVVSRISSAIQLFKSQLIVVPPSVREEPYLHTDSGTLGQVRNAQPDRPLMLSVQYFLSALPEPEMGNFTYVPGSHRLDFPDEEGNPDGRQSEGFVQGRGIRDRVQLCVQAGDAVVFPHSLWHGVSRNASRRPRRTLIYSYSLDFLRPYDYESAAPSLLKECTPRQRRLLGDLGGWAWRPGCRQHPAPDQEAVIANEPGAESH